MTGLHHPFLFFKRGLQALYNKKKKKIRKKEFSHYNKLSIKMGDGLMPDFRAVHYCASRLSLIYP